MTLDLSIAAFIGAVGVMVGGRALLDGTLHPVDRGLGGLAAACGTAIIALVFVVGFARSADAAEPTPEPTYALPEGEVFVRSSGSSGTMIERTAGIHGTATWYCSDGRDGSPESRCTRGYGPDDLVGAVDPSLGIPKGTWVNVRHAGRSVDVRIVDVCACRAERVIDLTIGAFQRLARWELGEIGVTLRVRSGPSPTPPATDTAPMPVVPRAHR